MNVSIIEVGVGCLTSNAFNLAYDLNKRAINTNEIIKINNVQGVMETAKEYKRQLVVILNEADYITLIKNYENDLIEFNGVYSYKLSKIFPVVIGKDYEGYIKPILFYRDEINKSNGYEVYKLFNVNVKKVKSYFEIRKLDSLVFSDGLITTVKFNISNFSVEDKWEFLKNFVLEFKDYIYAESDVSLAEQLIKILKIRKLKLSTAESFTAGGIASYITSVSGASEVFYEGIVSYSENSKQDRLGVLPNTLKLKRPVSSETAYEMCKGVINKGVDIAVATTGLAGPNSDGSGLPVGLVFIAVGTAHKISVFKYNFSGSRKDITCKGIETAVFLLIKALKDGSFNV